MSRAKKSSRVLIKAKQRSLGIGSISPDLDFGDNLSLAVFNGKIVDGETIMAKYNAMLSEIDGLHANLMMNEIEIKKMSARMLKAVAAKYGTDSPEYEKAGGVRDSERKHPKRKVKVA
jgi:hypothetical protein